MSDRRKKSGGLAANYRIENGVIQKNVGKSKSVSGKYDIFCYPFTRIAFWIVFSVLVAAAKFLLTLLMTKGVIITADKSRYIYLMWQTVPFIVGGVVYAVWVFYGVRSGKCFTQTKIIKGVRRVREAIYLTVCDKIFWLAWILTAAAFNYCVHWGTIGSGVWFVIMLALAAVSKLRKNKKWLCRKK